MTADLTARITEILRVHIPTTKRRNSKYRPDVYHNDPACRGCDWTGTGFLAEAHQGHIAALIVEVAEQHYRGES